MKPVKFNCAHPLYDYTTVLSKKDKSYVAVFRFQHWVHPPKEVMELFRSIEKVVEVMDLEEFSDWEGGVYIHRPHSKQVYKDGVEQMLKDGKAWGTALGKSLVKAVEATAPVDILDSWDNGSNSGHGFSVAFRFRDV